MLVARRLKQPVNLLHLPVQPLIQLTDLILRFQILGLHKPLLLHHMSKQLLVALI